MKFKQPLWSLLGLTLLLSTTLVQAQVTIGTTEAPAKGALLDLKEETKKDGSADSQKGVMLPRVLLLDATKLMMGRYTTEYLGEERAKHIGLMVYNTPSRFQPQCDPLPGGVYVWEGSQWRGIGTIPHPEILPPSLSISLTSLEFKSGQDARGAVEARDFTVHFEYDGLGVNAPFTFSHLVGGGMQFTANPFPESPLVASPAWLNLTPDAMPTPNAASPWQTRRTLVEFTAFDECEKNPIQKGIYLEQTNYAMKVNNSVDNSATPVLKDTNTQAFPIQTNNTWKVTVSDPKGVLQALPVLAGGADITTGAVPPIAQFYYTANPGGAGMKYETATIKFEDTVSPKRAKDVTVTTMSCLGTPNAGGLRTAIPAETSGANIWKTDVVRHLAKSGIYEEFLSADFGAAGRWMTTNLSAWAYDTRTSGTGWPGGVATLGTSSYVSDYKNPQWGYPSAVGNTIAADASLWTNNKHLGILYNWPAATGKQNPATTNESGAIHATVQGICPTGWHLPSDREFTNLENRIKNYTPAHSTVPTAQGTPANDTQYGNATSIFMAAVMKDVCEPGTNASKPASASGLALLLTGYAVDGTAAEYGRSEYLWSSSSQGVSTSWSRNVLVESSRLFRNYRTRHFLLSVRCVKD